MTNPEVLLTGLAFGESPRWHDDRLWFANWGSREIRTIDVDGRGEIVGHVPADLPCSLDWLPDGRLLVVSGPEARLLVQEPDRSLVTHADLSGVGEIFNEIVVDARGNVYVNGGSSDFSQPGVVAVVTPGGSVREVAGDIAFGNGMAITEDGSTLIVAESWGHRLTAFDIGEDGGLGGRRVWADLGEGTPDGICLDAEGAVWYADVPNRNCVRVREGGEVLDRVEVDRGCFACMLGGPDRRTLFVLAAEFSGFETMDADLEARTGQVLTTTVEVPGAGRP
jgi:sugar lactone lactonase YvrE